MKKRGQATPEVMLIVVLGGMVVFGVAAVGHVAKVGWKQTVCLFKTAHHCKATPQATAPLSQEDGN